MDYVSALNGQQMDEALTDVALRNSEAWAVGTRNGVNVTSADETWHNNAKYYAQVAQSAIPGTYTAAVRWDIDQGLAGEAQEQARANISAGASNRNLLDNPWWGSGEVVNQRSVTAKPSSNGAYCIDRWTWNSGADANNMSLGANGITFTSSASNIWFAQKMANPSALVGKTITGSVMLSDGTIKSGSVVYASVGSTPTLYQDSAVQIYISSVGAFSLTIKTTQTIRAVKLELGSYSTLANDVPPDYGEELAKCQRYFIRLRAAGTAAHIFGSGYATSNTNLRTLITLPVTMRSTPSRAFNGTFLVFGNGSNGLAVTNMTVGEVRANGIALGVTTSGLTSNQTYHLTSQDSTAYLDFIADL